MIDFSGIGGYSRRDTSPAAGSQQGARRAKGGRGSYV